MSDHEHTYAEEQCIECGTSSLTEIAALRAEVASLREEVEHLKSWQKRAQKAHPGCAALDDLQGECRCEVASLRAREIQYRAALAVLATDHPLPDGTTEPEFGKATQDIASDALAGRGPEARGEPFCGKQVNERGDACNRPEGHEGHCSPHEDAKPRPDDEPDVVVEKGTPVRLVSMERVRGLLEAVDAVRVARRKGVDLNEALDALAAKRKEFEP